MNVYATHQASSISAAATQNDTSSNLDPLMAENAQYAVVFVIRYDVRGQEMKRWIKRMHSF